VSVDVGLPVCIVVWRIEGLAVGTKVVSVGTNGVGKPVVMSLGFAEGTGTGLENWTNDDGAGDNADVA
jgi:hypothetical protein